LEKNGVHDFKKISFYKYLKSVSNKSQSCIKIIVTTVTVTVVTINTKLKPWNSTREKKTK